MPFGLQEKEILPCWSPRDIMIMAAAPVLWLGVGEHHPPQNSGPQLAAHLLCPLAEAQPHPRRTTVRRLSPTPECSPSRHKGSTQRRGSSYHRCPFLPQRCHSSPGIAAVLQGLSQWEWVREKGCHVGMKLPTWRCGFDGNVRRNHCPKAASGLNSLKQTRFLPSSNSKLMIA